MDRLALKSSRVPVVHCRSVDSLFQSLFVSSDCTHQLRAHLWLSLTRLAVTVAAAASVAAAAAVRHRCR